MADNTNPFSLYGRPSNTKYVFGKTNLPGALNQFPGSPKGLNSEENISNKQTFSSRNNADQSNHDSKQASDQSQTLHSLPNSSKNQPDAKAAPPIAMKNLANVDGSFHEKIDQLKTIREENKKSKSDEEVLKPKQQAINTARIATQTKQLEDIEADRRTAAILQTQSSLLAQIVKDTQQQLRTETMKSIQDDITAKYAAIANQHKAEVEARLIKDLTPKIEAQLRSELEGPVKQELYTKIGNAENLMEEVKHKLAIELVPIVKADLRLQLTDQIKQEIYAKADVITMSRQAEMASQIYRDMAPKVETTVRKECQEQMRKDAYANWNVTMYQLEAEVKDKLSKDLEPSVKESLRKSLKPVVFEELQNTLLPGLNKVLTQNMKVHEEELRLELKEKIKAELKASLKDSMELELRQEIDEIKAQRLGQKQTDQLSHADHPESPHQSSSGSAEQGLPNVMDELAQKLQSRGDRSNPVCGDSKKRRHSFDGNNNDHYNDNGDHDKKRRRSAGDQPHYRGPRAYLPGEVLGMSQPKARPASPPHSMIRQPDTLEREVEDLYGPGPGCGQDYYGAGATISDQSHRRREEEEESGSEGVKSGDEVEDFDEEEEESEEEEREGRSADDLITVESSDEENSPGEDEEWGQGTTLVGDELGVVEGKGEEEEEVEEEEL